MCSFPFGRGAGSRGPLRLFRPAYVWRDRSVRPHLQGATSTKAAEVKGLSLPLLVDAQGGYGLHSESGVSPGPPVFSVMFSASSHGRFSLFALVLGVLLLLVPAALAANPIFSPQSRVGFRV